MLLGTGKRIRGYVAFFLHPVEPRSTDGKLIVGLPFALVGENIGARDTCGVGVSEVSDYLLKRSGVVSLGTFAYAELGFVFGLKEFEHV